jgi:hypothetical protein
MPGVVPGSGADHSPGTCAADGRRRQWERVGRRGLDRPVSRGELRGVAQCLHHGQSPRRRRCARPAGAATAGAGPHPAATVGVDAGVVVGGVGVPASRAGAVGGRRAHGVLRWGSCRGVSLRRLCRGGGGTGRHPRAGIGSTWGVESAPGGSYLCLGRPAIVKPRQSTPSRAAVGDPAEHREEERRCVHVRCCALYPWR